MISLDEQLEQFRTGMQDYDLVPPKTLLLDGRVHRVNTSSKNGRGDGAYWIFCIGDYITGWYHNWQIGEEPVGFSPDQSAMTRLEKDDYAEATAKARLEYDEEKRLREIESKAKFLDFYTKAKNNVSYEQPYCRAKKIGAVPGVKLGTWNFTKGGEKSNTLLVPISNAEGKLLSCQGIFADGTKSMFPGLPMQDGFFMIGTPSLHRTIIITESYSNAYSLHKALDCPTAVSFGAQRMLTVTQALTNKYPDHKIILAPDNDFTKLVRGEPYNTGVECAQKVLENFPRASCVYPPEDEAKDKTDWNGFACEQGYAAVRAQFAEFINEYKPRLYDIDDLETTAPQWLIKGVLEMDSLVGVYGASGVGKSYIAFDMAASIATGKPFLDTYEVDKGLAIYVIGEGFKGVTRRRTAWKIKKGVDNFARRLIVSKGAFQLLDPTEVADLIADIEKCAQAVGEPPKLIVIDTLARNFGAGDENSTADMSAFVSAVDGAIRAKFQCCVMVVHHSGNDKTRQRGSSALKCALDTEINVAKDEENPAVSIIRSTKTKDGDSFEDISVTLDKIEIPGLIDNFGEQVSSYAVRLASEAEVGGGVFSEAFALKGGERVSYQEILFRIGTMSRTEADILEFWGNSQEVRQKVSSALIKLIEMGYLIEGEGIYQLTATGIDARHPIGDMSGN